MIAAKKMALALALAVASVAPALGHATIAEGGVVNAASFLPPSVPGGGIAPGSFFTIFGSDLGPEEGVVVSELPLPTELAGVSVTVTSDGTPRDAFLHFVSAGQVNAVMSSEVPPGEAEVTVTFEGETSEPVTITIVENSFGIFSATGSGVGPGAVTNFVAEDDRPINSSSTTATGGQVVTIWGTGLLGTPGADAEAPSETGAFGDRQSEVDVQVLVAGRPVGGDSILYAGRSFEFPAIDQINLQLPQEVIDGCFVPLVVLVDGEPSNEVTIAVGPENEPCSDSLNPLSRALIDGESVGALANVRVNGDVAIGALQAQFTLDVFAGSFSDQAGDAFSYNRFMSLPPVGSCSRQVVTGVDLLELLGGNFPDLDFGEELDGGPSLTLMRDDGEDVVVEQDPESPGRYVAIVGGGLSLVGPPPMEPFYEPGEYTITSEGGPEVGPIDVTFMIPERPVWLNREAITSANVLRGQDLIIEWEAGDPQAPQIMVALAASLDTVNDTVSGVVCLMPQTSGGATISSTLLSSLAPSSPADADVAESIGLLGVGSLPTLEGFEAEGLDLGLAIAATIDLQSVTFE